MIVVKYFPILLILFLQAFSISGQNSYREDLYKLYISDRMGGWEDIMQQMNRESLNPEDTDLLFELLLAEYGFIGYCLNKDLTSKAEQWLEKADYHIEKIIAKKPEWSSVYAIKAAMYGFRINLRPAKAIFYGPRNQKNIDKALALDPEEPMAWFEYGNSEFFRPAAFGGSKTTGIQYYQKAIGLFEKDPARIPDNWFYLNMLMMLAYAYEKTSQPVMAQLVYGKILRIEPDFTGIREKIK